MATDLRLLARDALEFPALSILGLICLSLLTGGCGEDGPTAPGNSAGVEETVELVLTARGSDDLPLAVDAGGVTTVAVGEEFNLELGYIDCSRHGLHTCRRHRPQRDRGHP